MVAALLVGPSTSDSPTVAGAGTPFRICGRPVSSLLWRHGNSSGERGDAEQFQNMTGKDSCCWAGLHHLGVLLIPQRGGCWVSFTFPGDCWCYEHGLRKQNSQAESLTDLLNSINVIRFKSSSKETINVREENRQNKNSIH